MNRCEKHPEYDGLKAPKGSCPGCLSLFASVGALRPGRVPTTKGTRVMRDRSKYSRRKKHPGEES